MRRFWGLVLNEYIKVGLKISTIIMLAVVVVVALGFNVLVLISSNIDYTYYGYYETIDDRINGVKNSKEPGWEYEVMRLEYMRDHDIEEYSNTDFREEALHSWCNNLSMADLPEFAEESQQYRSRAEKIKKAIDNNDYLAYLQISVDEGNSDESTSDAEKAAAVEAELMIIKGKYAFASWQERSVRGYVDNKRQYEQIKSAGMSGAEDAAQLASFESAMLMAKYRLDNNIANVTTDDYSFEQSAFWSSFISTPMLLTLIGVLIVIIAGSAISSEFSQGTVKFLLINPTKRWKIFLAKFISIITSAVVMITLFYVMNLLFGGILFGFGELSASHITSSGVPFWVAA